LQRDALGQAGCEEIIEEAKSGSHCHRPGLACVLDRLRQGDPLVVWKLDRLGRNVRDLIDLVGELEKRGVHFRSDAIDTSTPAGRFFFHVTVSFGQRKRELLIERTRVGLYANNLRAAGVPVQCRLYRGVTHEFFGLGAVIPQARDAEASAGQGLRTAFGQ